VVSHWLSTVAAWVWAQVRSYGICGGQSGTGQVFSEYFGFPCQFSFHRLFCIHHHLSAGAGTIGQLVADVPSGLSLTSPREKKTATWCKEEEQWLWADWQTDREYHYISGGEAWLLWLAAKRLHLLKEAEVAKHLMTCNDMGYYWRVRQTLVTFHHSCWEEKWVPLFLHSLQEAEWHYKEKLSRCLGLMTHWTCSPDPNGSPLCVWKVVVGRQCFTLMVKKRRCSWWVKDCDNSQLCPLVSAMLQWCLSR
jgi:hypothetical protein